MERIKSKQVALLIFTIFPITKLILMPSVAATYLGNNSYIAVFLCLLIDFAALLAILNVSKRNPHTTFKQLLSTAFGKKVATIILSIYAAYFFIRMLLPIFELRGLLVASLYDAPQSITMLIPIILMAAYVSTKGLWSIGKCVNILGYISIISIVIIMLLSIGQVDISNLLPFTYESFFSQINFIPNLSVWFGDGIILLALLGKIEYKKIKVKSIVFAAIFTIFLVATFVTLYISIYGNLTFSQINAVVKISRVSTALSKMGRFDWIPIILLLICHLFAITVLFFCTTACAMSALNHEANSNIISIIIAISLLAIAFFVGDNFTLLYSFFTSSFSPIAITLQYLFPLLLPLINLLNKDKTINYEQQITRFLSQKG